MVPTALWAVDVAFAARYTLGHHVTNSLTGLDPFTHSALRPAHSLSTLRGRPRDRAARKTRYRERLGRSQLIADPASSLFPRTGLSPAG